MRARLVAILTTAALAPALAACGGGGPSRADYLKKADPECALANAELAVLTKPATMTQVADAAGKLADVTDAHLVVLRKIGQPGGKDGTAVRDELADLTSARPCRPAAPPRTITPAPSAS